MAKRQLSNDLFVQTTEDSAPVFPSVQCDIPKRVPTLLNQTAGICHYLDDTLLIGSVESSDCQLLVKTFKSVCERLGVPLAPDKEITGLSAVWISRRGTGWGKPC